MRFTKWLLTAGLAVLLGGCVTTSTDLGTDVISVKDDAFTGMIEVIGPRTDVHDLDGMDMSWELHAIVDRKTAGAMYALHFRIHYPASGHHKFTDINDDEANVLPIVHQDHSRTRCEKDCYHWDVLDASVDEITLRHRAATGFQFEVFPESGGGVIGTLRPVQIEKELAQVMAVQAQIKAHQPAQP